MGRAVISGDTVCRKSGSVQTGQNLGVLHRVSLVDIERRQKYSKNPSPRPGVTVEKDASGLNPLEMNPGLPNAPSKQARIHRKGNERVEMGYEKPTRWDIKFTLTTYYAGRGFSTHPRLRKQRIWPLWVRHQAGGSGNAPGRQGAYSLQVYRFKGVSGGAKPFL